MNRAAVFLIFTVSLFQTCYAVQTSQTTNLLDKGLSEWQNTDRWQVGGSVSTDAENERKLSLKAGTGIIVNGPDGNAPNLHTKQQFADCVEHIEFMVPEGSNSGVYFMGRYEIQVFDSWGVNQPQHSDCGGIYQRWDESRNPQGYQGRPPKANASLPPGSWQCFDVIFKAPRFDKDGNKTKNAEFVKVVHNGILIHENQSLTGPTRASTFNDEKPTGPLMLQGDHGPVAYRNIRIATPSEKDDFITNPFFAMDTGTKDDDHASFDAQFRMISEHLTS